MHEQNGNGSRRQAIVKILRDQAVAKQEELVRLLKKQGYEATQSSVSRDLQELGVGKIGHRYVLPAAEHSPTPNDFAALSGFVREIKPAGSTITVVRTSIGSAQSVALAVDRARVAGSGRHDFRGRYDLRCNERRARAAQGHRASAYDLSHLTAPVPKQHG